VCATPFIYHYKNYTFLSNRNMKCHTIWSEFKFLKTTN
jgi:hypothetical protein